MGKFAGFSSVQLQKPKRSQFDLSHAKRSSTKMGRLTPVLISEVVPGDSFYGSSEILLRMAPLLSPIYDSIMLFVHCFFVPNRLLWEEWEEFITGGRLGVGVDPVTAPVPPFVDIGDCLADSEQFWQKSGLLDYLGVPILPDLPGYVAADYININLDIMPALAYQRVWYDFYRDRNFVADDVLDFPYPSGEFDATQQGTIFALRTRDYEKDYFTSALPFTQRGEEVLMPLAGTGSVNYRDASLIRNAASGDLEDGDFFLGMTDGGGSAAEVKSSNVITNPGTAVRIDNIEDVVINTSSVSINDFRSAYAMQVWLERNAIGGSRYVESTQAHFGVRPQDSRLQRAEYIGGGRIPVKISEIVSTAYSQDSLDVTIPLANLAGHGLTYGNTNSFRYFAPEHGFIICVASIMAQGSYHQGLSKMWRRRSFLDYPWPTFAKLGEQRVDRAELFATAANLTSDANGDLPLFGYQSRYVDWKWLPNTNHGEFHDTLLFWTLTRVFATTPVLGSAFNAFDLTSQERIFAVNVDADNFWLYIHNKVHVKRALPYFGTPNTLGF